MNVEAALKALKSAAKGLDAELLKRLELGAKGPAAKMYKMPQYFMGYLAENLAKKSKARGKRFRPALSLYLAQEYGAREKALDAALAIELFHNFTLIHDDVEDNDEYRRGKPTVWKLWGVNHAINSGDALSLLASKLCVDVAAVPEFGQELAHSLLDAFREVCEGQYLDFELAAAPITSKQASEKNYLVMARKKAGVLVGISAEAAGIAGGANVRERALLRAYGEALGTAYQIADDSRSIWGKETGKSTYGDVRERKRSFPIIAAVGDPGGRSKVRLVALLDEPRPLMDMEVIEAVSLIDATNARTRTLDAIRLHGKQARDAAELLSISKKGKDVLRGLIDALIPEAR